MNWTPQKSAGTAYLLPSAATGLVWYTLFFSPHLHKPNYSEMLQIWFVESPDRAVMWGMAFLTVSSPCMAAAYFLGLDRVRGGATALCAAGTVVAGASWLLADTFAIFLTFPLLFTVPLVFTASRKK